MVKEYWADHDQATDTYCVFDVETGHAISSWASRQQAQAEADRINNQHSAGIK